MTNPKWEIGPVKLANGDEAIIDAITTAEELGFDNRAAWDAATEEEKMTAVQDYFYGDGYPEWSWDDKGKPR